MALALVPVDGPIPVVGEHRLVGMFSGYTGFTHLEELTIEALRPATTRWQVGTLASRLTGTNLLLNCLASLQAA
jgi:hypothetical protein